jgi:hypothetical protein
MPALLICHSSLKDDGLSASFISFFHFPLPANPTASNHHKNASVLPPSL